MSKGYEDYSMFADGPSESVGGVTGSVKVRAADNQDYQLKKSILDAKFIRRVKAGPATATDQENFGEAIASMIGRALTHSDSGFEFVPSVSLVYDQKNKRTLIASRYLRDVVGGDLNRYAKVERKVKTKKSKVKITTDIAGEDELFIGGDHDQQIKKDICLAIALSAIVGDHDINPGNLVVTKDSHGDLRVARIDLGHAFNDLLRFGPVVGGGIRNRENQILDFLNRQVVTHINPASQQSKLWRYYKGIIPSLEMAESLREIANAPDLHKGLNQAKASFASLVDDLLKDPKGNAAVIDHIKRSLIAISDSISLNKISPDFHPQLVVDLVFRNIGNFCSENQKKMMDAAMLMEMQANLDKMIYDKSHGIPVEQALIEKVKLQYIALQTKDGIALPNNKGIRWVRTNEKGAAFEGNIQGYIKQRSKSLGCDPSLSKDFPLGDDKPLVGAEPFAKTMALATRESFLRRVFNFFKRVKELLGFVDKTKLLSSPALTASVQNDSLAKPPSLTHAAAARILRGNVLKRPHPRRATGTRSRPKPMQRVRGK